MDNFQPAPSDLPTLPPGHPLEGQLQKWVQLRDQLAEVSARLEYLHLLLRLHQR